MISIVEAFKTQNLTLSELLEQAVVKIQAELSSVSEEFKGKCETANSSFNASISAATEDLRQEAEQIKDNFASGNETFKGHLASLGTLPEAISKVNAELDSINARAQTFHGQFSAAAKIHEEAIAAVSNECTAISAQLEKIEAKQKEARASISTSLKEHLGTLGALRELLSIVGADIKSMKREEKNFQLQNAAFCEKQERDIASLDKNFHEAAMLLQGFDKARKNNQETLLKIEKFLAESVRERKNDFLHICKFYRNIKIYLFTISIVLLFLVIYPFVKVYLGIFPN